MKDARERIRIVFVLMTMAALLAASCSGPAGAARRNPRSENGPTSTLEGGGGSGPGEEPQEPEESEEGSEGGDEIGLVPLDPCNAPETSFSFGIQYNKVTWFGPPRVDLGQGGFFDVLPYSYDPESLQGTFSMPPVREVIIPITVTFPGCRSEPYQGSTTFRPRVEGTCKMGQIALTVYESWDSVTFEIPCEANSDVCGDDPCVFPYPLPFAYAGEAGIPVEFVLGRDGKNCTPPEIPLDFQGMGATGQKIYRLDCY